MDIDFFASSEGKSVEEQQGGSLLTKKGELTRLKIKTVAGSKLNPADRKKAEELVKVMHQQGELLSLDYIWCAENNISWR